MSTDDLDQRMIRELRTLLREMRDTNPARYRELFDNLIPVDALPSEVYSDRQLDVIYAATKRGLERRAARMAAAVLHQAGGSGAASTGNLPRSVPVLSS